MKLWILERLDHFVHLLHAAHLVPERVEFWICDWYEDAVWEGFDEDSP